MLIVCPIMASQQMFTLRECQKMRAEQQEGKTNMPPQCNQRSTRMEGGSHGSFKDVGRLPTARASFRPPAVHLFLGLYDEHSGRAAMFSVLRHEARAFTSSLWAAARPRYATTGFVPPASAGSVEDQQFNTRRVWVAKPKPESPNTYTGRADFFDSVDNLEAAITYSRQALRKLQLLPLPQFALQALPPAQPAWKSKQGLSDMVTTRLTPSRYSRIVKLLQQLDEYKRIATVAGYGELADSIADVLEVFERDDKEAYLSRGQRKPVPFDEFGRTYTIGRRKESHARVWVIRTKTSEAEAAPAPESAVSELNMPGSMPSFSAFTEPAPKQIPTTQVLVNNTPLAEYLCVHAFTIPRFR